MPGRFRQSHRLHLAMQAKSCNLTEVARPHGSDDGRDETEQPPHDVVHIPHMQQPRAIHKFMFIIKSSGQVWISISVYPNCNVTMCVRNYNIAARIQNLVLGMQQDKVQPLLQGTCCTFVRVRNSESLPICKARCPVQTGWLRRVAISVLILDRLEQYTQSNVPFDGETIGTTHKSNLMFREY